MKNDSNSIFVIDINEIDLTIFQIKNNEFFTRNY